MASTTRTSPDALERIRDAASDAPARSRRGWLQQPWRPALALATVVALILAGVVFSRSGRDEQRMTTQLPPSPPELTGTVVATSRGGAPVRFDLTSPGAVEEMFPGRGAQVQLSDGRIVDIAPPFMMSDAAGGSPIPLPVDSMLESVAAMSDGQVAMIVATKEFETGRRKRVVRIFDPTGRASKDYNVPSNFLAEEVAAGPDGTIAVLGERAGVNELPNWEKPELLLINRAGKQRRLGLKSMAGERDTTYPPTLSWGPSGLITVSTHPHPYDTPDLATKYTWTLVIDPGSGDLVRAIDGYQGLAWSPDGRGLLLSRRAGPEASELAVWWGPELAQHIDLGRTETSLAPEFWTR